MLRCCGYGKRAVIKGFVPPRNSALSSLIRSFSYHQHDHHHHHDSRQSTVPPLQSMSVNRATNVALSARVFPLGTLKQETWDDMDKIMTGWQEEEALSGYALDSVEKLLQRLVYEQAATFNAKRRKSNPQFYYDRELLIAEWQHSLLHGWLLLAQKQDEPEMISITAERAEAGLSRIVDCYNIGEFFSSLPDNHDPLPVSDFIMLVQQWLRVKNPEAVTRGLDLLMSWTDGEHTLELLETHKQDVVLCFNEALNLCTDSLRQQKTEEVDSIQEDMGKVITLLVKRMDFLRELGWEGLDEVGELTRKTILLKQLSAREDEGEEGAQPRDNSKSLHFEQEAVYKRMIELISVADKSDLKAVEDAIARLKASKDIPFGVSMGIVTALTDYFIRIKDAKQATHWLQRLDTIIMASPTSDKLLLADRLKAVMELWSDMKDDAHALQRVSELVRRLEELKREHSGVVDYDSFSSYSKLVKMSTDSKSNHAAVSKKLREFFQMVRETSSKDGVGRDIDTADALVLLKVMAEDTDPHATPKEEEMDFMVKMAKARFNEITNAEREEMADSLLSALHNYQMHDKASQFVVDILQDWEDVKMIQSSLREKILRLALKGMSTKQSLETIERLGGFDEDTNELFDLGCYDATIPVLFRNADGDGEFYRIASTLLNTVLDKLIDGRLSENKHISIESFLTHVGEEAAAVKSKDQLQERAELATEVLLKMEHRLLSPDEQESIRNKFPSSPIPLSLFNKVMARLNAAKRHSQAEVVFLRLFDYCRLGGYAELLPDKVSLSNYMDAVVASHQSDPAVGAKKMETMLFEWLEANKTGSGGMIAESWKLDRRVSELILGSYKRANIDQAFMDALDYLDKVLPLESGVPMTRADASFLLEWGIRFVHSRKKESDDRFQLIERFVRRYIINTRQKLFLSTNGWQTVMKVCASCQPLEKDAALKAALFALAKLRQQGKADDRVYDLYLTNIRHNTDDTSLTSQLAVVGFENCCEDGYLTPDLIKQFSRLVSKDEWQRLYEDRLSSEGKIPERWSRAAMKNVGGKGKRQIGNRSRKESKN